MPRVSSAGDKSEEMIRGKTGGFTPHKKSALTYPKGNNLLHTVNKTHRHAKHQTGRI